MTGEWTARRGRHAAEDVRPPSRQPVLANRYRLDALLGSGGMGDVWRATDLLLHQTVAVKQLRIPPDVDADAARLMCERTLREARAAARLRSHPSIVTIHDVVIVDDRPWIVMELVDGQPLDKVIATRGPLPVPLVATIGLAVLDGLSAAHQGSVLHRDVKPANVLLCGDNRVVLTDFGIATMAGDAPLTRTDLVNGSPGYVAPERLNGDQGQAASDLWSLGATLYHAVEGRSPYQRDEMLAILLATINADPDPMRLAGPLAPLLTGLLERDPQRRLTAAQAHAMLQAISRGEPAEPPNRAALEPRRARGRLTTGMAVVLALGLGVVAVVTAVICFSMHGGAMSSMAMPPMTSMSGASPAMVAGGTDTSGTIMADPEACSLFTDNAVSAVLGVAVRGRFQTHSSCMWSAPDSGAFMSLNLIRMVSVARAQDAYTLQMQNMRDEPRRDPDTRIRAATTVGDESFAYLKPFAGSPVHPTMLIFRKRNMLAIIYVSATKAGYGQADKFAAAVAAAIDKLG